MTKLPARAQRAKKFDAPVPLSEFARRGKSGSNMHTGHGRRDSLTAGERTRILRMLRDEGGRLADEDSALYGAAPGQRDRDYDFDFDDSPAPAPAPAPIAPRPDIPAKPAVVVGLAQAQAARNKRTSERIPPPPQVTMQSRSPVPPPPPPPRRQTAAAMPVPAPRALGNAPVPTPRGIGAPSAADSPRTLRGAPVPTPRGIGAPVPTPRSFAGAPVPTPRRPVPTPFGEEPTRQVDDALLSQLRHAPPAKASPRPSSGVSPLPRPLPRQMPVRPARPDDPTRMGHVGSFGHDDPDGDGDGDLDREMTLPSDDFRGRFLPSPANTIPNLAGVEDHRDPDEATRLASLEGIAAMERARSQGLGSGNDERTRAVNIRSDPSISDIDWDID